MTLDAETVFDDKRSPEEKKQITRNDLYKARTLLEAMRLEASEPGADPNIQVDVDAQTALVAQLRKDLSK